MRRRSIKDQNGTVLGVINLEHSVPGAFTEEDAAVLQTLATQASIAQAFEDLGQTVAEQAGHFRALRMVAERVQEPQRGLDSALRLILTGITALEGMGCSRAAILMWNSDRAALVGRVGIGAADEAEAREIWTRLGAERADLAKQGQDVLDFLLGQAIRVGEEIETFQTADSPYSRAIRGLDLPRAALEGALRTTIDGAAVVTVEAGDWDFLRGRLSLKSSFTCLPIKGSGESLGVLLVDTEFQSAAPPFDKARLQFLRAFSEMAAAAIMAYGAMAPPSNSQQSRAWESHVSDILHSLGAQIMLIQGAIKGAQNAAPDGLSNIAKMAQALNSYVRDIREYSRPNAFAMTDIDLADVARSFVKLHSGLCHMDPAPPPPCPIRGDSRRIVEALNELLANSVKANVGRSDLRVTLKVESTCVIDSALCWQRLIFADNGVGIPIDRKGAVSAHSDRIGENRGRGLHIVRQILRRHERLRVFIP